MDANVDIGGRPDDLRTKLIEFRHGGAVPDFHMFAQDFVEGLIVTTQDINGVPKKIKVKFPLYTIETMCYRPMLKILSESSLCGGTNAGLLTASIEQCLDLIQTWNARWVVEESNRVYFRNRAAFVMSLFLHNLGMDTSSFPFNDAIRTFPPIRGPIKPSFFGLNKEFVAWHLQVSRHPDLIPQSLPGMFDYVSAECTTADLPQQIIVYKANIVDPISLFRDKSFIRYVQTGFPNSQFDSGIFFIDRYKELNLRSTSRSFLLIGPPIDPISPTDSTEEKQKFMKNEKKSKKANAEKKLEKQWIAYCKNPGGTNPKLIDKLKLVVAEENTFYDADSIAEAITNAVNQGPLFDTSTKGISDTNDMIGSVIHRGFGQLARGRDRIKFSLSSIGDACFPCGYLNQDGMDFLVENLKEVLPAETKKLVDWTFEIDHSPKKKTPFDDLVATGMKLQLFELKHFEKEKPKMISFPPQGFVDLIGGKYYNCTVLLSCFLVLLYFKSSNVRTFNQFLNFDAFYFPLFCLLLYLFRFIRTSWLRQIISCKSPCHTIRQ